MGTNYYQEYSEDDPPDLNDISPEDIDVADISEDLINFGKSAENALPEGALDNFQEGIEKKMKELQTINKSSTSIVAEELKSLYQDAILQLEDSEKTVLDNLKEKESNYFTYIIGSDKYNTALSLRYNKMVEQHISKYNAFFNKINTEIKSLIKIFTQLSNSNQITTSALMKIQKENVKIKKHLDQTYGSIHTNDRKTYYINNEIGKMNIVNGIALLIYYACFIYYAFKTFNKQITPKSVVIILLLFLLPIAILPFILFILKSIVNKVSTMYTSGPQNMFLNNNIYKPPKDLSYYNNPPSPKKDDKKNENNTKPGFLWF